MRIHNTLNPYAPAVLAWTLAWLCLAVYAVDQALTIPLRSWEPTPGASHGDA